MRKILSVFMAVVMCFVMNGCDNASGGSVAITAAETVQAATAATAAATEPAETAPSEAASTSADNETAEAVTMTTTATAATEATTAATTTATAATEATTAATTTTAAATTATTVQTTTTKAATTAEPVPAEPIVSEEGALTLLGSNMVYLGESYSYTYSSDSEDIKVGWKCKGNAGHISQQGVFRALKVGTAVLTVTDKESGSSDSLTVHVVDNPENVDFIVEVNGIPIANKTYPVPKDLVTALTPETASAFAKMQKDAKKEGLELNILSGYRPWYEQYVTYQSWYIYYGGSAADRVSARAGHSEHQIGLAIDVNSVESSFADTPEGKWIAKNCYKYGFIIRYPKGCEQHTGYAYEPWHIRYLGKELAYDVHFSGLCLEEYLGIDSRYRIEDYNPF